MRSNSAASNQISSSQKKITEPPQSTRASPQQVDEISLRREALDSKFFNKLLQWEEDFYCHILTSENLNQLVQSYSQLVEYYDFLKDPIKAYFLEKMQFTLSRPQVIKMMVRKKEKSNHKEPISYKKLPPHIQLVDDLPYGKRLQTINSFENNLDSPFHRNEMSLSILNNDIKVQPFEDDSKVLHRRKNRERAATIKLQVELETQISQDVNVSEIVKDFQQKQTEIEAFMDEELNKQQQQLDIKLQARKNSADRFQLKRLRTEQSLPQFMDAGKRTERPRISSLLSKQPSINKLDLIYESRCENSYAGTKLKTEL